MQSIVNECLLGQSKSNKSIRCRSVLFCVIRLPNIISQRRRSRHASTVREQRALLARPACTQQLILDHGWLRYKVLLMLSAAASSSLWSIGLLLATTAAAAAANGVSSRTSDMQEYLELFSQGFARWQHVYTNVSDGVASPGEWNYAVDHCRLNIMKIYWVNLRNFQSECNVTDRLKVGLHHYLTNYI